MSVDLGGITIMAVSITDTTPVTPTPKRTAFNLDERDAYLTPPPLLKPSPGAMSLGTGTNPSPKLPLIGTRAICSFKLSQSRALVGPAASSVFLPAESVTRNSPFPAFRALCPLVVLTP
ncbi:hypothetical protein RSOL_036410, partial [Rhizoctonia solani AG-3 Rhs1AP]